MQPVMLDDKNVARFKGNNIVVWLLDQATKTDMNQLALLGFSQEDREQFAQLIGYSVSGFRDLSYVSTETACKAAALADALVNPLCSACMLELRADCNVCGKKAP